MSSISHQIADDIAVRVRENLKPLHGVIHEEVEKNRKAVERQRQACDVLGREASALLASGEPPRDSNSSNSSSSNNNNNNNASDAPAAADGEKKKKKKDKATADESAAATTTIVLRREMAASLTAFAAMKRIFADSLNDVTTASGLLLKHIDSLINDRVHTAHAVKKELEKLESAADSAAKKLKNAQAKHLPADKLEQIQHESTTADAALLAREKSAQHELTQANDAMHAALVDAMLESCCAHDKLLAAVGSAVVTALAVIAPAAKTSVATLRGAGRLPRLGAVDDDDEEGDAATRAAKRAKVG